jgi:nitrogenase molybdenum-iron protein alpha/beta subunit
MVNVGGFSSFAPPAQTNINMPDPSAKEVYSALAADREKVMSAFGDDSDDEAIKQLASGKAFTGLGAEQKLIAAKALEAFGVNSFNDEIKDTEVLKARILRPAIAGAKQLGVNPTDKDLAFLLKVEAGEISLGKDTIKKVAEARMRLKDNRINAYNDRLDSTYPKDDEGAKRYRGSLSLPSSRIRTWNPKTGAFE